MENWIASEFHGQEAIVSTPTSYTNNEIALQYLDHLILHTRVGLEKPWKILLLDGHKSHCIDEFQLKAKENHILPYYFPSHLTHILQPLDIGIFQPWKHYHDLAIQAALYSLDFEYTITSFFHDITSIRKQTMKYHTIVNSFCDLGMWPISAKEGLKKMRAYNNWNRKRTTEQIVDFHEDSALELKLPPLKR
jgi:hypothetical protein